VWILLLVFSCSSDDKGGLDTDTDTDTADTDTDTGDTDTDDTDSNLGITPRLVLDTSAGTIGGPSGLIGLAAVGRDIGEVHIVGHLNPVFANSLPEYDGSTTSPGAGGMRLTGGTSYLVG
jgi:hypothetical protein